MKTRTIVFMLAASLTGLLLGSSDGLAAKGGTHGPPDSGETGSNNLSFPLILSDNATPAAFPLDGAWRFAPISDPTTECIGEEGVIAGEPVPAEYLCYYGRHVTVVSETGDILFDGEPCPSADCMVWWLQKRVPNFWKTLSIGHDVSTPLVVSAIDVGDLLESSPAIQARQIRVEFNLLQSVAADDPELGKYVVSEWNTGVQAPCAVPQAAGESLGCFAALAMSGAVPGTEQSGNEMQGTEFGPGPDPGPLSGSLTLRDPVSMRGATTPGGEAIPIHALVYSNCARLVIQKIAAGASWDESIGQWAGPSVGAPLVNIAAYDGSWSTEITSGGSIVYGYNWNAKTASTGTYRLTMVLDGNDAEGPICGTPLATRFEMPSEVSAGTQLVNQGEANLSTTILYAGGPELGDEGGLVYIDVPLTTKGGGGGGGKRR